MLGQKCTGCDIFSSRLHFGSPCDSCQLHQPGVPGEPVHSSQVHDRAGELGHDGLPVGPGQDGHQEPDPGDGVPALLRPAGLGHVQLGSLH